MRTLFGLVCGLVFLLGCSDPFGYSPFEVTVPASLTGTNARNIEKIRLADKPGLTSFKVALIADPHYHFSELKAIIQDINSKDFAFIIVAGDITENGLQKEFEIFHTMMSHSRIPYITVIGNHDHLANGAKVYRQIFGDTNFSFSFGHTRFVCWDNTTLESASPPDVKWIEAALGAQTSEETGTPFNHVIPVSHIPPNDSQSDSYRGQYHAALTKHNISLSLHGHRHEYGEFDYGDGIRFLTIGSPQKSAYAALYVTADSLRVEKIKF